MLKNKILTKVLFALALFVVAGALALRTYLYYGTYTGKETSPDGRFTLKYYVVNNPFAFNWTMPGDSVCRPLWLRLYDQSGGKMHELRTDNCNVENRTYWDENQVILPDGQTIWPLVPAD